MAGASLFDSKVIINQIFSVSNTGNINERHQKFLLEEILEGK